MAGRLQFRRGTTLQNEAFTGAVGEPTLDTETGLIHIHDGQTQGGMEFVDAVVAFQKPTAENNYTWYRKYASGWVEQGGITTSQTINLPITMADANYHVLLTGTCNESNNNVRIVSFRDRTTSSFFVQANVVNQNSQSSASNNSDKIWEVKGMAA